MTTTRTAVLARSARTFRVTMKNNPMRSLRRVCGLGTFPKCLLGAEGSIGQAAVLSLYSVTNELFSSMIHNKEQVKICIPVSPIVKR